MARVVIVGSGAGGLATAARLATRRHDVTVVEAGPEFGGRLRPIHGVSVVPEIITLPAPLRDLFNKTGGGLDDVIALEPAPPTLLWLHDNRTVEVPSVDPAAVGEALGSTLGAATATQFRELMGQAAQLWQHLRRPLLETPGGSPTWLVNQVAESIGGRWKAIRLLQPHQSYAKAISILDSADARALLDLEALQAGSVPQDLPAWVITRAYVRYLFGEWVVPGGNAALADVLATRASDRKAQLRSDARVVKVLQAEGRVTGVQLQTGEVLPADWVVWANDSVMSDSPMSLVPGQQPRDLSAFVLELSVPDADVNDAVRTAERITVLPQDRERALVDLTEAGALTDTWLTIERGRESGDHAQAEQSGIEQSRIEWTVRAVVGAHTPVDAWDATHVIDALVSRGLIAHGRAVRVHAQRDAREIGQHLHSVGGRLHGPASPGPWRGLLRAPVTTPIAGLLRAGGGVVAGPGVPYAVQTGEVIADLIGRPSASATA